MTFKIFHQLGHNGHWNIDSDIRDDNADGYILSPRHMDKDYIERTAPSRKKRCLFDPQFFKPHIPKGKLARYDFFPELLAPGVDTSTFESGWAVQAARACVSWQIEQGFHSIIIPNRHEAGMPHDYIAKQESLFVTPFLQAIAAKTSKQPVLIQLVINNHMLLDDVFRVDLLNWVTGLPGVAGVYLILEIDKRPKQIRDQAVLFQLLLFIDALSSGGMDVVIGYTNAEALLLTLASPIGVTLGSYETTRIFNIRNFEDDSNAKASPAARIYASRILQWINSNYVEPINAAYNGGFFDETPYHADMFEPTYNWHFNKPELYNHYFYVFSRQLREIRDLEGAARWRKICSILQSAMTEAKALEDKGIFLDQESQASHIGPWLTVAHKFAKYKAWT